MESNLDKYNRGFEDGFNKAEDMYRKQIDEMVILLKSAYNNIVKKIHEESLFDNDMINESIANNDVLKDIKEMVKKLED